MLTVAKGNEKKSYFCNAIKKMREGEKCFSKTLCCVAAGAARYIVPGIQQRVAR